MTELRTARPGDEAGQRALWALAFGDDEAQLDAFYATCYRPEETVVLTGDGAILSMAVLAPAKLVGPGGEALPCAYLFALATHPDARGKGYGRRLMAFAHEYLKEGGCHAALTTPAQSGLFPYFTSAGYVGGFVTRHLTRTKDHLPPPAPGDRIEPISPKDYNLLREALLGGTLHLAHPDPWVAYQQRVSALSGAGLYRLTVDGRTGLAAVECRDRETVVVKELLTEGGPVDRWAALIAHALPGGVYHLRFPVGDEGELRPFAMMNSFSPQADALWQRHGGGYLGLALD